MANPVVPSTWYDTLQNFKSEVHKGLRVCVPGKIAAVDTEAGTVDVDVMLKMYIAPPGNPDKGVDVPYPQLTGCPVFTVQGGGVGAVMPVAVDDECLVVFGDRCVSAWFETGEAAVLPNLRTHDISDGFVLVGLNSQMNALSTSLVEGEGGLCETQADGPGLGARVAIDPLTHKIAVANATQNLGTILTAFLTAVSIDPVLAATSPGVTAAAIAANLALAQLLTMP